MNTQLVLPMVAYVLYMFALALFTFLSRVGAIKRGEISHKYFRAYSGPSPDRLVIIGRHYDNQFQLPLLFLSGGILHTVLNQVSTFTLVCAWGFILSRLAHSYVHLGNNHVLRRAMAFAFGWFCVAALWAELLFAF